jgi:hypothetical protein
MGTHGTRPEKIAHHLKNTTRTKKALSVNKISKLAEVFRIVGDWA